MNPFGQGGLLISKIHQITGRIFSRKLKEYDVEEINPAQGRVLCALWQNDSISIQELAKLTSLGSSTLTSMLDRLEHSGYLVRVPGKEDRRKTLIELTKKNSEVKAGYERVVSEISDIYYKGFDKKEIEQFENYLKRVFDNLLKSEGEI